MRGPLPRKGEWWKGWSVRLEFKVEDFWVGAFWRLETLSEPLLPRGIVRFRDFDLWVCVVPMVPIHVTRRWWEDI